jgi:predicted GIY-YIG superfamily endonuclease
MAAQFLLKTYLRENRFLAEIMTEQEAQVILWVQGRRAVVSAVRGRNDFSETSRGTLDVRQFWVYMVECADGTLYTGSAKELDRRLAQHNSGRASKYTRSRLPVTLVYAETSPDWSSALSREARIKRLSRGEKMLLRRAYEAKKKHSIR